MPVGGTFRGARIQCLNMNHLPKITIKPIPHEWHRYETVGDYYESDFTLPYGQKKWNFRVSKTNADYEFLVVIHELVEWFLAQKRGIKEEDIYAFDTAFEAKRVQGNTDEPGNDEDAPYRKEHEFAEMIERLIAKELGIEWAKYDEVISKL